MNNEEVIDFPTLGFLAVDWIEQHCVIPDSFNRGNPFILSGWQLVDLAYHYRVKPGAEWRPDNPMLASAFNYRRTQIVRPQKTGKSPLAAAMVCAEALGPVLFAGWAEGGEVYRCSDHGCDCGWVSEPFEPGDPMGMPWPTPLIQLTATSVDQVGNVYDALRPMIEYGSLYDIIPRLGEEFIRLPNGGRIDAVTSKARSRLGQRVTFVVHDESALFSETNGMTAVADTQRRGLAGMGGRSIEVTNPWNPAEDSVAQRTYEAELDDVFIDFPSAPPQLSYGNKQERHRIHKYVYADSPWVDLDNIEAEAYELLQFDPGQAERFFGNRVVYGQGQWLHGETWDAKAEPQTLDKTYRVEIVLGFDGSDVDDWTALRAETKDGYMFTPTYGPSKLPTIWNPAEFGGQVPRLEVSAAVEEVFRKYHVVRMYADPPGWETEIDEWAETYGEKTVIRWPTYRGIAMHTACERLLTDTQKINSGFSHDGCPITAAHVRNARMSARNDDRYVLAKASQTQKIDACIASILTHEAAGDVAAKGLWRQTYGIKMA